MKETATPKVVSREEWERARAEQLVREKEHTHANDALAAARRRLPMTPMEPVTVDGSKGPVPLHEAETASFGFSSAETRKENESSVQIASAARL